MKKRMPYQWEAVESKVALEWFEGKPEGRYVISGYIIWKIVVDGKVIIAKLVEPKDDMDDCQR